MHTPSPAHPRALALVLAGALVAAMSPVGLAQLAPTAGATTEPTELAWEPAASPTAGPAYDVDGNDRALVVSTWHDGTLRSTDDGRTWSPVDGAGVTALDVLTDPSDPDQMYLAGNGGISRSTDAGASFEPALEGHLTRVAAVSAEGTVAASLQPTNGADDQLRISEDGGDTWAKLATPYEGSAALEGLAFGPTDDHLVLADLSTTWVTTDGGQTWTQQDTGARLVAHHEGTVWRYGFSGLERSADGGQTWTHIPLPGSASAIGPHPEQGLYAATDQGVLLTQDDGQTWTDMGADELAWQATGLIADPEEPGAVFFSDETIGVNRLAPDGEGGFSYEGRSTGFTPTPVWTLATSPQGDLLLAGGPQGLWATTEAAEPWSHTGAGIGMTGVEAATAGPGGDVVYAGGSDWTGLAYVQAGSLDGTAWTTRTLDGNNDGKVVDLETHPADGEVAWAAVRLEFAPSKVFETRDGGQTWEPLLELGANPPLATVGEAIHAISYDEATAELLAATEAGVLAHQGSGVWTPRAISGQPTTALAAQAGHVYADGPSQALWKSPHPGALLLPWADTPAPPSAIQPSPHGQHAWVLDAEGAVHACTPADTAPPGGTCQAASPPVETSAIAHAPASGTLWAGSLEDGLHRAATR